MALSNTQKAIISYLIDTLEEDNLEEFVEATDTISDFSFRLSDVFKKIEKIECEFNDHITDHLIEERNTDFI